MSNYESILAGTEVQGKKEELLKLQDYVLQRWSEITGIDASNQDIHTTDEPRIVEAVNGLKASTQAVFDVCVTRILKRSEEQDAGVTPDEQSDATEVST